MIRTIIVVYIMRFNIVLQRGENMSERIKMFIGKYRTQIITIALMIIFGTLMHFVTENIPNPIIKNVVGSVFPINESSWEHMKMLWWPFLIAGIIISSVKKDKGYFGGFVIAGFLSILLIISLFAIYQSFTITTVLFIDITIFSFTMILCGLLAFSLAKKDWVKKGFVAFIVIAAIITAALVVLTFVHGKGYLFLDDEGLK